MVGRLTRDGEALEQRVGVLGKANLERPARVVEPDPVEDDHPGAPRSATKLARVSTSSRGSANDPACRRL